MWTPVHVVDHSQILVCMLAGHLAIPPPSFSKVLFHLNPEFDHPFNRHSRRFPRYMKQFAVQTRSKPRTFLPELKHVYDAWWCRQSRGHTGADLVGGPDRDRKSGQ
ncbi:hypothetical protein EDB81DRAFT_517150 [Dactylonectria macrodidyma]|uniref:Uncharacterized protein n=1 Tax=Dactylonectria macrodidyma TaxID=307937 RepID=A0A9P9EPN9_9HYPO|nr:hypothetical protein EDB81DRAFT_517150 [Dactylonectria macrodidyma]